MNKEEVAEILTVLAKGERRVKTSHQNNLIGAYYQPVCRLKKDRARHIGLACEEMSRVSRRVNFLTVKISLSLFQANVHVKLEEPKLCRAENNGLVGKTVLSHGPLIAVLELLIASHGVPQSWNCSWSNLSFEHFKDFHDNWATSSAEEVIIRPKAAEQLIMGIFW